MLISAAKQTTYDDILNKLLAADVKSRILNSSVSLKGKNPKKTDFDGSAAMLCYKGNTTFLVSAKHNLEVYWEGGSRPPLNQTLLDSFRQSIKIYYQASMQFNAVPAQVAVISEVIPVKIGSEGDWDYDVMILKSTDPGLLQVCKANQIYPLTDTKQKQAYDQVVKAGRLYLSKTPVKDSTAYFIQSGFGRVRDTVEGTSLPKDKPGPGKHGGLQYRDTAPKAQATDTVYFQVGQTNNYEPYIAAIQLDADANSSTFKGDSGGPLYFTYFDKSAKVWRLFVIGVTTGGDMSTAREPCPPKGTLVANNISTSLAHCYSQGLFQ
ncbi:MAG: hypothetical protein ABW208_21175 [Pyrinomonadaceae bacterium]